jgi:uncharacterized damage-inducible protein DinB
MDVRLTLALTTLRLNTRLFLNCLDGIDETVGARRPNGHTNSLAFVAAHLVDVRHFTAASLGVMLDNPYAERLAGARGIDDLADCPTLAESRQHWRAVAAALETRLTELDAAALDAPAPQRFPVDDASVLGEIAFLLQHEAYHIGQLALLRKFFGAPAMSYRRPAEPPASAPTVTPPPPAGAAPT